MWGINWNVYKTLFSNGKIDLANKTEIIESIEAPEFWL